MEPDLPRYFGTWTVRTLPTPSGLRISCTEPLPNLGVSRVLSGRFSMVEQCIVWDAPLPSGVPPGLPEFVNLVARLDSSRLVSARAAEQHPGSSPGS